MPTPRTRMTREKMLDNRQQAMARAMAALHPQVIASVLGGGRAPAPSPAPPGAIQGADATVLPLSHVKQFQQEHGLPVTGVIDSATRQRMARVNTTLEPGVQPQQQAALGAVRHATPRPSGLGGDAAMAVLAARRAETKPAQLAAMSPQGQTAYHQRYQQRKALGLSSLAGVRGGDLQNLRRTGLLGAGHPSTTGQQQPARGPGDATGQTPYTPAAPVAAQQQESMANLLGQRQGPPAAPNPGGEGLLALVARLLAARGR